MEGPGPCCAVGFLECTADAGDLSAGISQRRGASLIAEAAIIRLVMLGDIGVAGDIDATGAATEDGLILESNYEPAGGEPYLRLS